MKIRREILQHHLVPLIAGQVGSDEREKSDQAGGISLRTYRKPLINVVFARLPDILLFNLFLRPGKYVGPP